MTKDNSWDLPLLACFVSSKISYILDFQVSKIRIREEKKVFSEWNAAQNKMKTFKLFFTLSILDYFEFIYFRFHYKIEVCIHEASYNIISRF